MSPPGLRTAEEERQRIAVHELGHFLACVHYRIPANPKIPNGGLPYVATDGTTALGECRFECPPSLFVNSTIGWSGVVAEILCGVAPFDIPFPLNKSTLRDWYQRTMCQEMSQSDRLAVRSYKRPFLSFKAAYRILRGKKAKLAALANVQPPAPPAAPVPLPSQWPASRDDFLRLVVAQNGDASGAECYGEFFKSRVVKCWANTCGGDFAAAVEGVKSNWHRSAPSKTDAEIQAEFDATFAEAVAGDKRWFEQACFQNEESWREQVRQFRKWASEQPVSNPAKAPAAPAAGGPEGAAKQP